jgi:hypothetical protein
MRYGTERRPTFASNTYPQFSSDFGWTAILTEMVLNIANLVEMVLDSANLIEMVLKYCAFH